MSTRLVIIRHGQTQWNADGRFMGQADIPLDEVGERQAQAVARRLAGERPAAICASDLQHAWHTAQEIQAEIAKEAAPEPAPCLIPEKRLREMKFGDWQGLTYPEIQLRFPETAAAWETNMLENAPSGGETLLQLAERVQQAYDEIHRTPQDQNHHWFPRRYTSNLALPGA